MYQLKYLEQKFECYIYLIWQYLEKAKCLCIQVEFNSREHVLGYTTDLIRCRGMWGFLSRSCRLGMWKTSFAGGICLCYNLVICLRITRTHDSPVNQVLSLLQVWKHCHGFYRTTSNYQNWGLNLGLLFSCPGSYHIFLCCGVRLQQFLSYAHKHIPYLGIIWKGHL